MTTLTASDARKDFLKIVDRASENLEEFTITKGGTPKVVIMSAEELESWKETLEILSNKPLMKDIEAGLEDIKHGRTVPFKRITKR